MNGPPGVSDISLDNQNVSEEPYMDYLPIPPVALHFPDTLEDLNPSNSRMVEADDVVNDVMDQFVRSIFIEDDYTTSSTVSSTFHPLLLIGPMAIPDVILKSSDGVLFFVHYDRLLSASVNDFDGHLHLLFNVGCIDIPESSEILNIILHIVYNISCAAFNPTLTALVTAVDIMVKYGLPTHILIGQNKSIFSVLQAQMPLHPIDVYVLAAHHDIEPLAKLASGHLLSFVMHTLSSYLVGRMGSRYMKRLYFLQLSRLSQLKDIVFIPPDYSCCECKSDTMRSAWALSAVSLVND